ncbi:serine threonine-protein kinase [Stylonychia lemnae]|uniref:Serine threonine-protein kinase n=1 Tax=Stylonychia lemnae TaxID=5949 RepID=A0A078AIH5_STYLE|nr:serine threonine-protein kinase [Stylonychia lemnae]|eukprot:CDW80613.1 serine threonine-protein kinase [Stylonychia lemnae]
MEHLVQLKIKDTADRYRILKKIGAGGQAVVYLAQDFEHPQQQLVALKQQELEEMLGKIKTTIIKQHQCTNCLLCNHCNHCQKCQNCQHKPLPHDQKKQIESENLAKEELSKELLRLLREISSIQLKHLNIVEIYDSYLSTDNKFISISELAQQDLKAFVEQRQKKLTTQEISMIFLQIVNGLEYIHDQNFIHRDISPQNILVFQDSIIKICDFGFASYGDQTSSSVGKQEYIAPEVLPGNQNYNKSIDIWSLGVTLYYLCTGSTLCDRGLINVVARGQNHIDLPLEHKIFQPMFDQMLQLKPQNRPSASKIKEDLMNIIDEGSPIYQNYQSSLLTHLMNQHKNKLQKQEEDFEKQILAFGKIIFE